MSTLEQITVDTVPLSSSGLLERLMVVSPELGLWARAAASFWAKSLWRVREEVTLCVFNQQSTNKLLFKQMRVERK